MQLWVVLLVWKRVADVVEKLKVLFLTSIQDEIDMPGP
jgi:hypothetical protein